MPTTTTNPAAHTRYLAARNAAIVLAAIAVVGSAVLVTAEPASAADCNPPMVVDPADGAFAGDPITVTGPNSWNAFTGVEVFLDGISLGNASTGFSDSWELNTTVPALSPGTYTLEYVASPLFGSTYSCDLMQYTVKGVFLTLLPGATLFTTTTFPRNAPHPPRRA